MKLLDPAKFSKPDSGTQPSVIARIEDYYRETIEDYQCWSRKGYMHFGIWDRKLNPFHRESMLERMNDYLFDLLKLNELPESCIGDFGCGLAAVTGYGADKFPQHRWVGLTISAEQVAWANERLHDASSSSGDSSRIECHDDSPVRRDWPDRFESNDAHPDRFVPKKALEILCADYHQTPFHDQSLGGIFFLESLCHSSDILQALKESFRVLGSGRRVVIVDGMMKRPEQQLAGHVRWLMRATCRNWAVPHFHYLQDLLSSAEACGFKVLQANDISWSIVPSVMHSPLLIARRALTLAIRQMASTTKAPSAWQWRHLRACWLGMFLGLNRRSFGYYSIVLEKPTVSGEKMSDSLFPRGL